MRIYDLIYLDNRTEYQEATEAYRSAFPNVKIEDASDFLHTHRFAADFETESVSEYYEWLLDQPFTLCSFHFQMDFQSGDPVTLALVRAKLDSVNDKAVSP